MTRQHIADGYARAILCNSGNANTCNKNGEEIAHEMCCLAANELKISDKDVIVASTGVIGQPLDISPIKSGMGSLCASLSYDGSTAAAEGIMTTDTVLKETAVSFKIGNTDCVIGGIAKGSGMIHPNMATMLVFITTDVDISPEVLQAALSEDVRDSFNMISIDGDTSTNDMCCILANKKAGNEPITAASGEAYEAFKTALAAVTKSFAAPLPPTARAQPS